MQCWHPNIFSQNVGSTSIASYQISIGNDSCNFTAVIEVAVLEEFKWLFNNFDLFLHTAATIHNQPWEVISDYLSQRLEMW